MRLSDAMSADRIILDLQATNKDEAISELIDLAAVSGGVEETPEQLLKLVLEREALTSTAVDRGVAIPHTRSNRIEGVVVSLGIHRDGLDFGSLGGDLVHLVFLVLSADSSTPAYLSVLGRTARIFRRPQMLQSVLEAEDANQILQYISDHEPA
ncbi:MAG: PTS sugar transporter subunit IIA [Gemmatimonadetes bacterium]|jgi:mannitol/fructose-specific phosphotransferase system IIA component (Ntr-type)|nr:PTS sugar transporter subunit IIA [Gemmatimonadota bacterium]MBT5587892.1 PTS sugar transporter subunit IIA [Gemmatimonadota bacterium]MBT6626795.1 PTS sugar transporter subunit IIA [Gemmatimonadota bacterium]